MGYKLAGFNVLGYCEIDVKMAAVYDRNLHPKLRYNLPVQSLKTVPDLPPELFSLDILDGSPPCSVFSMAGNRENDWGKERQFREGQAMQRLDDLFGHFIDVAERLKPKFVVAENVKGLILGNAKGYVKEIFEAFDRAGYAVQLFLLNASRMGVPQARERTFFIARRKDLNMNPIALQFDESPISCLEAFRGVDRHTGHRKYGDAILREWKLTPPGKSFAGANEKGHHFNWIKLHPNRPACTVASSSSHIIHHWKEFRSLTEGEIIRLQSFPDDYDFAGAWAGFVCGMSVPPLMMERLARKIRAWAAI